MRKILKAGVYNLRNGGFQPSGVSRKSLCLVVRTSEGTSYLAFSECDFLNGWSKAAEYGSNAKRVACAAAAIEASGEFMDAMLGFSITPTFLSRCGNASPKRVKWAQRRKPPEEVSRSHKAAAMARGPRRRKPEGDVIC